MEAIASKKNNPHGRSIQATNWRFLDTFSILTIRIG